MRNPVTDRYIRAYCHDLHKTKSMALSPEIRLAYYYFKMYVRSIGTRGMVRMLRVSEFSDMWNLSPESISAMIENGLHSEEFKYVDGDTDILCIVDWVQTQGDENAADRKRRQRERERAQAEGGQSVTRDTRDTSDTEPECDMSQVSRSSRLSRKRKEKKRKEETGTSNTGDEHVANPAVTRDSLFEDFWKAFPKRSNNPKKPARDVWKKIPDEKLPIAVAQAAAYAVYAAAVGLDPQRICHARTWLSEERWDDDFTVDSATKESRPSRVTPLSGFEVDDDEQW